MCEYEVKPELRSLFREADAIHRAKFAAPGHPLCISENTVGIWQGAEILGHHYFRWSTFRYQSIALHFCACYLCTSYCLCLHYGTNLFVISPFFITDYLQWSMEFVTYKCELSLFSPQSLVPED